VCRAAPGLLTSAAGRLGVGGAPWPGLSFLGCVAGRSLMVCARPWVFGGLSGWGPGGRCRALELRPGGRPSVASGGRWARCVTARAGAQAGAVGALRDCASRRTGGGGGRAPVGCGRGSSCGGGRADRLWVLASDRLSSRARFRWRRLWRSELGSPRDRQLPAGVGGLCAFGLICLRAPGPGSGTLAEPAVPRGSGTGRPRRSNS
jgi:hypothetical protein